MHGTGIFQWKDGKQFIGEYKYDKKEGYGRYIWNSERYFEGYWKDGKQNGMGVIVDTGEKSKKIEYSHYKAGKAVKGLSNDEIEVFKQNEHIKNDLINKITVKFESYIAKPSKKDKDSHVIMTPADNKLTVPNDIKLQYQSKSLKLGLGERPAARVVN